MEVIVMGNQKNKSDSQIKTNVTTKDQLIRFITDESNVNLGTVRSVYNTLENRVKYLLSKATPEQNMTVRLFEGITLDSKFVPEKKKKNNLTGDTIIAASRIKPKANITRRYCDKLNNWHK